MTTEELAEEYSCEELMIAYVMRERQCSKEDAEDFAWGAMARIDRYLLDN